MDEGSRAYFEKRERMERAAAKKAISPQARRAHQELAVSYAALVREGSVPAASAGMTVGKPVAAYAGSAG
jgi:hypothetical protein